VCRCVACAPASRLIALSLLRTLEVSQNGTPLKRVGRLALGVADADDAEIVAADQVRRMTVCFRFQ
jgi:hypothetical protein